MPPGNNFLDLTLKVSYQVDKLRMVMEVPDAISFPVRDIRLDVDYLSFTWKPTVKLTCAAELQEDGSYQGGCIDPWQGRGPLLLIPPSVSPDDVAINQDLLEGWNRPGHRNSDGEIINETVAPTTLVDLGGYQLNMLSLGEGDVTVVLEAGLGDDLSVWQHVQHEASEFTRVVSYDRAGLGGSEATSSSRSPEQAATELHLLLRKANLSPPYVLVGHAWGGFIVRRFASLYPDEVAGLVLVEPDHEKLGARLRALDEASWSEYIEGQKKFYSLAQEGVQKEFNAFLQVMEEEEEVPGLGALPDVPVNIIISLQSKDNPRWVGETKEGKEAKHDLYQAWVDERDHANLTITRGSGSYILIEEPFKVVRMIKNVVEAVQEQ